MAGGSQQIAVESLQDNPRQLGKGRVRLVDAAPLRRIERFDLEAEFTSSSDDVRALSVTRVGTWRSGAMRNRSEPDQVAQAGFGLE